MKPLAERLFLKQGMVAAVINAPDEVATDLAVTRGLKIPAARKVTFDWLLVFAPDQRTVQRFAPQAIKSVRPDGFLWFAYPKLTGSIRTDTNRDTGWEPVRALGFDTVAAVSIDDTWTALRFRPVALRGQKRDPEASVA
jgi:hypothetical protein